MLRSKLFWTFYGSSVALIILTAAVIGFLVENRFEANCIERTGKDLKAKARLLGEIAAVENNRDSAALEKTIRALAADTGARLTIIAADGRVLADSEENPGRMDNHLGRPEIAEARAKGFGQNTRMSGTLGVRMMYAAQPVAKDGNIVCFSRAALPLTDIDVEIGKFRLAVIATAACASFLALIIGFLLMRRAALPLVDITLAAENFAGGEYETQFKTSAGGEIGKLADAINRMAAELRDRMEKITRSRNEVVAILAGMVDGVVALDGERRVVHINDIAADILFVVPGNCIGKRIEETGVNPEIIQIIRSSSDDSIVTREFRPHTGVKSPIIEVRISPLKEESGSKAGLVLVMHDVTELRRLEQVRRDFVANVSHELKTPLTAIRGLIETLIDDPKMDEETHARFLIKARDQTARLSNLVTDLLTISRVESGEGVAEKTLLDLRESAQASARPLFPVAEAKGLSVSLEIPGVPVKVSGDPEAVRQIIDNLLDNAIKYTPSGGNVRVRIFPDETDAIIEVEDTGPGIEQKHLDRIFERFYRVDKARSRELGGTGLGLSIVKHLTGAMGGNVSVESSPGKGSIFKVRLPATSVK